jgi:hypothetical protein
MRSYLEAFGSEPTDEWVQNHAYGYLRAALKALSQDVQLYREQPLIESTRDREHAIAWLERESNELAVLPPSDSEEAARDAARGVEGPRRREELRKRGLPV